MAGSLHCRPHLQELKLKGGRRHEASQRIGTASRRLISVDMTLENGEENAKPKVVVSQPDKVDDGSDSEDERAVEVGAPMFGIITVTSKGLQ